MSTSGTSGTPWEILISPSEKLHRVLADLRAFLTNGYSFFDKTCCFLMPGFLPGRRYWFQDFGLIRISCFSQYDQLKRKLAILTKGNYDIISSVSSDLLEVAEALVERDIKLTPPKMVVTRGELLQPKWRHTIHQGFGRDPTDFYGTVEFGLIGWQCRERQGYHVDTDRLVHELVKGDAGVCPGEEGEVVITDLVPRAMPLIRFATEDWSSGSGAPCPCGIKLPTLSHISGRVLDFLLLPSGEKIAPFLVTAQLQYIPGIMSYQVTQVSGSEVVVRFIRRRDISGDQSAAIVEALRPVFGDTMQLHVQEVASIPRPPGKFRVVENALTRRGRI
ncbi:MAG: phenylacetate--CoA ligase family protein [Candidatus Hydrogenedentota bacterium]|nr:MAG: phenylacetate--CoA ligase family protein [Candidatus Hydrogenedentota bacterium]